MCKSVRALGCMVFCMVAVWECAAVVFPAAADESPAYQPGPLLQSMLDGDLRGVDEIVFAVRVPGRDHWYVSFGYYSCDYGPPAEQSFGKYIDGDALRGYGDGGRLCRLNLRTGQLTVLLDDPAGGVRDPQVHYDGQKILFSYRRGGTATYHLYEINIDGSGLKQLTDGPDDDIEPAYLPDGGIVFGSSRCRRFVNCWYSRVATLYRCDADGANVRMLSSNNDHDNTPWVLPDGRILYMRWEYVDRSQVHFHHLWTVNPDGTGQMTFYGNSFGGIAMLDAKPIPGSKKVVVSFSPGHGMPEHTGHVALVDPTLGPDDRRAERQISKGPAVWRDPCAMSEKCFLVSSRQGIFVMDGDGKTELVYQLPKSEGHLQCHEPRPLQSRPRERVISPRVDVAQATGRLFLADIYYGRNMAGVRRGEIKKLLVLEQLPMPVHFSGGMESISLGGTFTLARVLGTVPVEADGSAFFEVPAMRSLFFVALDENDLSVKRMQSFVTVQPGETGGCVGCHEQRTQTFPQASAAALLANRHRRPTPITPIDGLASPPDYPRDIQPILDRHCVRCHNPDRYEGRVDLTGDHQPQWSISYYNMRRFNLVADGRNEPIGNRPPRHDRQLGQPADAADRRQPLRGEVVRRGAKNRAAVDRRQRRLCRHVRQSGLWRLSGAAADAGAGGPLHQLPRQGQRQVGDGRLPCRGGLQSGPAGEVVAGPRTAVEGRGRLGHLPGTRVRRHRRRGLPETARGDPGRRAAVGRRKTFRHARLPAQPLLRPRNEAIRFPAARLAVRRADRLLRHRPSLLAILLVAAGEHRRGVIATAFGDRSA